MNIEQINKHIKRLETYNKIIRILLFIFTLVLIIFLVMDFEYIKQSNFLLLTLSTLWLYVMYFVINPKVIKKLKKEKDILNEHN